MLVYCNDITLSPDNGLPQVLGEVAEWLGKRAETWVNPTDLMASSTRKYKSGYSIAIEAATTAEGDFYTCTTLSHGDDEVPGRLWAAEVGVEALANAKDIRVSVLLRTNEISAKVTAPVTTTRPQLIDDLAKACNPTRQTPSRAIGGITASADDAENLRHLIADPKRAAPLVIMSYDSPGHYLISPQALRSQLVGLAQLLVIEGDVDTLALADAVGERFIPYKGAVNIVYAPQASFKDAGDGELFIESIRITPDRVADLGKQATSFILTQIAHRTNLPKSWRHTSAERVRQIRQKEEVRHAMERLQKTIANSEEQIAGMQASTDAEKNAAAEVMEAAAAALKEAKELIDGPDRVVEELRTQLAETQSQIGQLSAENQRLESQLNDAKEKAGLPDKERKDLSGIMVDAAAGRLNLAQALDYVTLLYPKHVLLLDSAYRSAKAAREFKFSGKALDLMLKLVTDYRAGLLARKPDEEASTILGAAYSAKEADLSDEGESKRTFQYGGKSVFMEQHLGIGTKPSKAETWRLHFHWDAAKGLIVIGHCGEHLPLKNKGKG